MTTRYATLDSLRGLAALVVVFHHHLLVLPSLFPYTQNAGGWQALLTYSPLHVLWAGGEAVVFFFVLSGFVLSLAVWQGRPLDMQVFIPRRIVRLWLPMIISVTLAWLIAALLPAPTIPEASTWLNSIWQAAQWRTYAEHLLLLGNIEPAAMSFTTVTWSLKWEMWGSLLLPVVLILARYPVGMGIFYVILNFTTLIPPQPGIVGGLLTYLPMFVLGATLARYRERIALGVQALHPVMPPVLLAAALLLIPAHWYAYASPGVENRSADTAVLMGAALLIALALGWPALQARLLRPVPLWLGRVSYSLYLYHVLVLAVVVRLGAHALPLPVLLILSLVVSLGVAHVAYEWVERPIMDWLAQHKGSRGVEASASLP